jgi:hypothetical protein
MGSASFEDVLDRLYFSASDQHDGRGSSSKRSRNIGGLSGGEKRFLRIATSLGGEEPAALSDVVPALDRSILDLVLAALAHAAGSRQDSEMYEQPEGVLSFKRVDTLHPWPKEAPALRVIDGGQG